ncbi:hypothetical protein [Asanoa iriomotensis]|uniref:Uncharacterized protein n=1 Tax=Asanoa iriomotensis TaxID=234613 RepID=A0ABQ4BZF1_9ACTN|nr:hypothetical protein [Asanoa iriomotensis]GIF55899.1 hypothetical protein Air01nite_19940 [Asanoa iriomotensis]
MSDDDDVVTRLRAGAPGYPEYGPDAGLTLAAARRALRRGRARRTVGGGVAAAVAVLVGLTAGGAIQLPDAGTFAVPFGPGAGGLPDQGDPPIYPPERLRHDVESLQRQVLPATTDLALTSYLYEPGGWGRSTCRVFTWSQGAFRDRAADCANPSDPEPALDGASEAAFDRVSDAIERSGVDVYRIEKGGWGPGTSFHLRDNSWKWNWYYSYIPGSSQDAREVRTDTSLGVRLQVHVSGDWWFTVEPDD